MAKKENSLAHTKWMCKYHIVFLHQSIDESNLQSIQRGHKRYYKANCAVIKVLKLLKDI